jgi:hypothetical protein
MASVVVPTRSDRRPGFPLTFERVSVAWIENNVRVERGKNPLFEPFGSGLDPDLPRAKRIPAPRNL